MTIIDIRKIKLWVIMFKHWVIIISHSPSFLWSFAGINNHSPRSCRVFKCFIDEFQDITPVLIQE